MARSWNGRWSKSNSTFRRLVADYCHNHWKVWNFIKIIMAEASPQVLLQFVVDAQHVLFASFRKLSQQSLGAKRVVRCRERGQNTNTCQLPHKHLYSPQPKLVSWNILLDEIKSVTALHRLSVASITICYCLWTSLRFERYSSVRTHYLNFGEAESPVIRHDTALSRISRGLFVYI